MFSLLFFDDWYLHQRTNFARHVGQPILVPEATLEDPALDISWGYPSVFRDPETDRWRCLYQGHTADGTYLPVVAQSDDGMHWTFPELTEDGPSEGRLCPHQVFGLNQFREWSGAYVDHQAAGTDAWLKGLVVARAEDRIALRSPLAVSGDGLHWRYAEGLEWHPVGADPIAYAFWNPYRASHVLTARPALNDRRIAIYETRDWRAFSPPELALQADALDTPHAEIYGMPVIPYEHMFVGLVWVYHTDPTVNAENKFRMGKVDCQLAYSHNGWHWQRTVRETFVPNSAPGEHGAGCIYPNVIIPMGDTLRIYSSAAKDEHAQIRFKPPSSHQSAILMHTLRRDGFVYLEPEGGAGELTTRLLLWAGGEPQLNVSAPQGDIRLQFANGRGEPLEGYTFADCIPFRGDTTAWVPEWRDGRLAAALRDQIVRLQVQLANGRLYAIRGDFEVKMSYEARLFVEQGVRTPPRPGF